MRLLTVKREKTLPFEFYSTLDEALINEVDYGADPTGDFYHDDYEVGVLVAYDVKTSKYLYAVDVGVGFERNKEFKYLRRGDLGDVQNVLDLYQGYIITAEDELKYEPPIW